MTQTTQLWRWCVRTCQTRTMRIATWNLAGRWSIDHRQLMETEQCDVWLLTEVPNTFSLDRGAVFRSTPMGETKAWAAVWSGGGDVSDMPAAHFAAAVATRDGVLVCSCVFPWRGGRARWSMDPGNNVAEITVAAVTRIGDRLLAASGPVVWGGDWNHALEGRECAGTHKGRKAIEAVVCKLRLQVQTRRLPHTKPGLLSIDHIAVPVGWAVSNPRRVVASVGERRLSDHDAYIVDCVKAGNAATVALCS
jgi:hypothetical protein